MIKHAVQNLTDLTVREIIQCVRHIADVDVQRFKLCVDDLCRTFVGMDHAEHRLLVVIVNAAALDKELCLARNIVRSVASQNLIIARFAVPALMFGIITLKHVLRNLERENLFLTGLKQNLIMKSTMLQQVMEAPRKITFRTVPVPQPQRGQVLIEVKRVGICGSDIHVYHGMHPFTSYPITQGHELSGQIVALGADVSDFTVGQRVTIEPQVFCGKCYPCRHGKYNLCDELKVMGFQTTGACSTYFAVDAAKVDLLPDDVSYDEGAMIEPLAVTVHAAKQFADIQGANVAILGAGPIGILLAQSVKALGARQVLITDVSDYRLSVAKSVGADFTVNTANSNFGDALIAAFGADKADVIYDCAGNDVTMGQAIRYARKGSTIILVAVFAKMASVDLAVLNDHELDLNTTMMYRHEDYVDAISFVHKGLVQLKPLMSRHFPFRAFHDAYVYIDENREKTMKVLIDVDDLREDNLSPASGPDLKPAIDHI